ncbi:ImmA/IrrE family metallo-endopeptidase [Lacticaseibacillus pantheris]|uniref:ImmA/IrrE family metallo-endopeptidase n=1 Tax=Lacticaseibacillus pantheris TaxID=171523 RepID=UPI00265854E1|nr:ImmA/IrrE family metallo-endopeptidase [Lacticaseibacillus pantheris]WKF85994.1 ImmA/IrrE family metallo-endopeptidase [Lacticaseibacillus pantheris]
MDAQEKLMSDYGQFKFKYRSDMPSQLKGLIHRDVIYLNKECGYRERTQIIAEEIGHGLTSAGDITAYNTADKRQQENIARLWGVERLVSLDGLIKAWKLGMDNLNDLADYFEVTPKYLVGALQTYCDKYGEQFDYSGYRFDLSSGIQIRKI